MAMVQICHRVYKTHQRIPACRSSIEMNTSRSGHLCNNTIHTSMKTNTRVGIYMLQGMICTRRSMLCHTNEAYVKSNVQQASSQLRCNSNNASQKESLSIVRNALESTSSEKHLRSLESYLGKLQNNANQSSSKTSGKKEELIDNCQLGAKTGLIYLNDYLGQLNKVLENHVPSDRNDRTAEGGSGSANRDSGSDRVQKRKNHIAFKSRDGEGGSLSSYDETSNLYLIGVVASVNIAVYLFEIASPIKNSELELFSLPSLYGGKINHLILLGEWWRLVTPMFLHSGVLHVALGCWVLLTFGPQVCKAYGSFTFFLIYMLGGVSGNLTSFIHTPDPTVGGTGPVFAIIGAWLIYQIQNRDVIEKDDAVESMFQKAIVATAFSFILSHFGLIDEWTHVGAAFAGIVYGFLTCPTLQVDNASAKTGQEEGITLVSRHADPCKSLLFFVLSILVLGSLLFFIEPPINSLAAESFT